MMNHSTPNGKRRKVVQFAYCVTRLGFTQKEAAQLLGISQKLAGKWVKEYRLRGKMSRLQKEIESKPMKFDESLSAYRVFLRTKYPELYILSETSYQQFLDKI